MSEAHPEISLTDVAWLTALARTLTRDDAEADDLVQETWVAARTSPPSGGGVNRPWLATVLRRFHLQALRSGRRRARRAEVAARPEALPDTAELVERAELQRTLADCLLSLDDPFRTTLMLVAFEGVTTAEIAERDGVSAGTVRHRVRRAREMMRERLVAIDGEDWSKWNAALLPFARLPLPGESGALGAVVSSKAVATSAKVGAAVMTLKILVATSVVAAALTALSLLGEGSVDDVPYVQQRVAQAPEEDPTSLEEVGPLRSRSSATESAASEVEGETVPESASETKEDEDERAAPVAPRPAEPETATLEIRILSKQPGWFASLAADTPAFVDRNGPSWTVGRLEAGFQMKTSGGDGPGRTCALNQNSGVYRFTNVRPGIPLRAIAIDGFFLPGDEVAIPPLLAGEERVVEVIVTTPLRTFGGRVLAPNGEPVGGASVLISRPGDEEWSGDTTTPDGRFALKRISAEELVLAIKADGFAPLVEPAHRVMDAPVEFVLDRGRAVRLQVRNADQEPIPVAEVVGRLPGAPLFSNDYGATDERGILALESMPAFDFPLEVTLGGRAFRDVLPAAEVDHVVQLPAWRSCRVRVVGPRPDGVGTLRVSLRPVAPAQGKGLNRELAPGTTDVVFDRVFPGTYGAALERVRGRRVVWSGSPVDVDVTEGGTEEATAELRNL
ncbi:MAG: sigma-70 family RNA polymerase sigma factor [Planctomycetota bacterium]